MTKAKTLILLGLMHCIAMALSNSALGATSAKGTSVSAKEKEKLKESETTAKIIQKIISSIDRSSCDFNFEIESEKETSKINDLDVKCMMQMNSDLRHEVFESDTDSNENSSAEKFKTEVLLKTKGLIVEMILQKKGLDGKLSVRFYSGYDKKTQQFIGKPLTAILGTRLNNNLLTIYLNSIDLLTKDDEKNPNLMKINGNCESFKELYNFKTTKMDLTRADCYVQGTYEVGVGPRLKSGYKSNVQIKEVLP